MMDIVRAFCISILIVPFSAYASVGGPMQPLATTPDDFLDASIAMSAGVTAEQAVLEQIDPIRLSMKFQAELFATLFDRVYSAEESRYFLHLADIADIESPTPLGVQGSIPWGDSFLFAVDWIQESDLSQLPSSDLANLAAAGIERVWSAAGQLSTSNGAQVVFGAILYGSYQGHEHWQFMPALDPSGEIVELALLLQPPTSSQGNPGTPAEPVPYNACADNCEADYDQCAQIADYNLAGCLTASSAAYAAALAGCAGLAAISWWTGVGAGAGALCVVAATAAWAGAVATCYAMNGSAVMTCRTLRDACLAGCCTDDPDGCPR